MTEAVEKPSKVPWTAGRLLAMAAFLAPGWPLLTGLIYAARGASPGQPVAELVAYAAGAALIPWVAGGVILVAMSRGKRLNWKAFGLAAAAMGGIGVMAAGQGLASRDQRAGQVAAVDDAYNGFVEELRQDYPDVYARRQAIMANAEKLSDLELGQQLAAVSAPALNAAQVRIGNDLAVKGVRFEIDEFREALAGSPRACWDLARGGPNLNGARETIDRRVRLSTEELRAAATSAVPPGPFLSNEESRALVHRVTTDNAADARIVGPLYRDQRAPASDVEAQALCRWQIATLETVLASGPVLAGKFIRGSGGGAREGL